jgi:hypothetical protein
MRALAAIVLVACSSHDDKQVTVHETPVVPKHVDEAKPEPVEVAPDPDKAAYDAMTAGSVPGDQLKPFVPAKLAGVERSNILDYPWSQAGAYKLDSGYANLDIQNTFHRGSHDTSLEDRQQSSCKHTEKVKGFTACVEVRPASDGGTAIRWYLPDRLTVRIAAPTEALARKMAGELDIAGLAKLSAAH